MPVPAITGVSGVNVNTRKAKRILQGANADGYRVNKRRRDDNSRPADAVKIDKGKGKEKQKQSAQSPAIPPPRPQSTKTSIIMDDVKYTLRVSVIDLLEDPTDYSDPYRPKIKKPTEQDVDDDENPFATPTSTPPPGEAQPRKNERIVTKASSSAVHSKPLSIELREWVNVIGYVMQEARDGKDLEVQAITLWKCEGGFNIEQYEQVVLAMGGIRDGFVTGKGEIGGIGTKIWKGG